jgi:hypothetical protein
MFSPLTPKGVGGSVPKAPYVNIYPIIFVIIKTTKKNRPGTDRVFLFVSPLHRRGFLKPNAALILEIGYAQGPAVKELLEQTGAFAKTKIEKDFHNNDRIVSARKMSS